MKISKILSFFKSDRTPRRPARNFSTIRLMHEALRPVDNPHRLDDQTWHDLEMDSVFAEMDFCTTPLGQQWLYHLLRSKTKQANSLRLDEIKRIPEKDAERAKRSLRRLNTTTAYYLVDYLVAYRPVVVLHTSLSLLLAILPYLFIFVGHNPLCYVLAVLNLAINFFVSQAYALKIASSLPYLSLLNMLADCAEKTKPVLARTFFAENTIQPNVLIALINIDRTALGDGLARVVVDYFDTFALLQLIIFSIISRKVTRQREDYIELTKAVAQIDVGMALREYCLAHPGLCEASIGQDGNMECVELRHPLLKKSVGNSFSFSRELVIITGSNMSGKSTFMKAVSINYVLASAFGICHAKSAYFPHVPIKTSLSLRDTVEEGASYYLKEISRMREMLAEIDAGSGGIYMIDEPLKGTNRPERIAILVALMKYLGKRSYFFLTTHDTELALDAPEAACYQFTSGISPEGEIQYGYVIRKGVSEDRFAVALLERLHFPPVLIRQAREGGNVHNKPICVHD